MNNPLYSKCQKPQPKSANLSPYTMQHNLANIFFINSKSKVSNTQWNHYNFKTHTHTHRYITCTTAQPSANLAKWPVLMHNFLQKVYHNFTCSYTHTHTHYGLQ